MPKVVNFPKLYRALPQEEIKAQAIRIGYLGKAEEIESTLAKCSVMYGGDNDMYDDGRTTLNGLVEGGMIAFRDGRPEAVQILLAADRTCLYGDILADTILTMFENSRQTTGGDLDIALEKMMPENRKAFLVRGMGRSVIGKNYNFARALIDAGAEAGGGPACQAFLRAAVRNKDKKMARLLYKRGASFEEAINSVRQYGPLIEEEPLRQAERDIVHKKDKNKSSLRGFIKKLL